MNKETSSNINIAMPSPSANEPFSSGSNNDFCNSSSNFEDSLTDFSLPIPVPNKTAENSSKRQSAVKRRSENHGEKRLKEQTATEMDVHL